MNWRAPFTPQLFVESVVELEAPRLAALGLRALLLDVDCTLGRYRQEALAPEVLRWLTSVRAAEVKLCLVSNGRGARIARFAAALELPFVAGALKPLPWGCRRALRLLGAAPAEAAMVGDQLFADIAAGHLAGVTTILVRPIHPEEEPWFTRLKRPCERWLLRRIHPQWVSAPRGTRS